MYIFLLSDRVSWPLESTVTVIRWMICVTRSATLIVCFEVQVFFFLIFVVWFWICCIKRWRWSWSLYCDGWWDSACIYCTFVIWVYSLFFFSHETFQSCEFNIWHCYVDQHCKYFTSTRTCFVVSQQIYEVFFFLLWRLCLHFLFAICLV